MSRKILNKWFDLAVVSVAIFFQDVAFPQSDSFESLIEESSHAVHAEVISAMLIEESREGIKINCGVKYQAKVVEDFVGRLEQGASITFRGTSSLKVGSEYLAILSDPSEDIPSGRCADVMQSTPVLETEYLIVRGSTPAKTHPRDERIGVIENIGTPFPESIEVQQRKYRDCGLTDFSDEDDCTIVKVESIFVWSDLSNYLRLQASSEETAAEQ